MNSLMVRNKHYDLLTIQAKINICSRTRKLEKEDNLALSKI
jgi:hypothetical protein